MENDVIKIQGETEAFRKDVNCREILELAKRVLLEGCDVDDKLGVVTEYIEWELITFKLVLETLLSGTEQARVTEMSLDEFMDTYDLTWKKYKIDAMDWFYDCVFGTYCRMLEGARVRAKAQASLSYRLSSLLEAVPALSEGIKSLPEAKAIVAEMMEAAALMQNKKAKKPAANMAGLYNFAKKK